MSKKTFIGKNVLLIAPCFFGYYKEMQKELEEMGMGVTYVCDAPSNSNISKALGRINKKLILHSTQRYFSKSVLPKIQNENFDYVLVVAGMTFAFTREMMAEIKLCCPSAKFVMYQWDSEKNLPYSVSIHSLFDRIYSFDRFDCSNNCIYNFLPLFYTKLYEEIGKEKKESYIYDCSYIGTAHPKKFKDISIVSKELKSVMPNQFIFHYMPSVLKFYYHRLLAPEFKNAEKKDFAWEQLSPSKVKDVFSNSRCILDSAQGGQSGLTIRSIECLGARRKLITTNVDISNYDFFREENILIFDGTGVDLNSVFFRKDYVDLPSEIYEKYSLENWLITLLDE